MHAAVQLPIRMRRYRLTTNQNASRVTVLYCVSAHCEQTATRRLYKPLQYASESEQRAARSGWTGTGRVWVCGLSVPMGRQLPPHWDGQSTIRRQLPPTVRLLIRF